MRGLVRSNPVLGLSTFNDFTSLFDDFFDTFRAPSAALSMPSVDIYSEDDRTMVVEVQAPGFDHNDIELNVNNGVLEIRGERTEKEEHKPDAADRKRSYMVRENSTSFYRPVNLPEGADSEKIAAELNKGVLKVTIPVERAEAKRIKIAAPASKSKAKKVTANTAAK